MKIAFRTEGGEGTGLGHLSRCIALAEGFQKQHVEVSFISRNYPLAIQFLQDHGYEALLIDPIVTLEEDIQQTIKLSEDADIVLVDFLNFSSQFLRGLRKSGKTLACIDDRMNIDLPVDLVIGNSYATRESYGSKISAETKLLSGTDYIPLRQQFQHLPKRVNNSSFSELLITLGGEDIHNITESVLEALKEYPRKLSINVLIGGAYRHLESLQRKVVENIRLFHHVKNVKEVYQRSDVAVTACGVTFWELAAVGVPMLAMETAENQKYLSQYIQKHKLAEYLASPRDVIKGLLKFEDVHVRNALSQRCQKQVDGKGVERIVETLIKVCKKRV